MYKNVDRLKEVYCNDIQCMKEYIDEGDHDLNTIIVITVAVYGLINISNDYWLLVDKILTIVDMTVIQNVLESNGVEVFTMYDDYIEYINSVKEGRV